MRFFIAIVALIFFVRLAETYAQESALVCMNSADTASFLHDTDISRSVSAQQFLLPEGFHTGLGGAEVIVFGVALGITLFAMVSIAIITVAFQKRFYGYLVFYAVCFAGLLLGNFFFPENRLISVNTPSASIRILCMSLMSLSGLLFLRRFLETRLIAKRLDGFLQLLVLCYGFVIVFVVVGYGVLWQTVVMPVLSLLGEMALFLLWVQVLKKKTNIEQFSRLEILAAAMVMLFLPGEYLFVRLVALFSVQGAHTDIGSIFFCLLICAQLMLFPSAFFIHIRDDNKRYVAAAQERLVVEQQALAELRRNDALRRANAEILTQQELLENQRQQIEGMNAALYENNQQLSAQNVLLKELHTEKDEVLGIVAHDLKNPLAAIASFANILRHDDGSLMPMQHQEFISHIIESAERMFEIIRNLLDINALERGGLRVELQPVEISSVLDYAVSSYRERAEEKRITIRTDFAPVPFALGDESLVMQVVDNLISNAVKYSPHGKNVVVRIAVADAPHDEGQRKKMLSPPSVYRSTSSSVIRFEVRDEGPGLTDDDKSKLFGKFARLSAQPTGGEHSTGLGLSIVKKMVDAMDGSVYCESTLGKGSAFIVELPVADYEG
jgi:signal transduction histidine kinase